MLIVLDNAADTEQVLPLLPGSSSCTVIVTSRHQLTNLIAAHEARQLSLDVLPDDEAWELLTRRVGASRVTAEPEAASDLLTYCAGLPLALSILAARVVAQPNLTLGNLAAELRVAGSGLAALDGGDPRSNLTTVFSWSYSALSRDAAELACLLGLAPGPDISLTAAASLTGWPIGQVSKLLGELDRASLVHEHAPARWRMHDLVKLYASERAHPGPWEDDAKEAALRRLVDFYVHTAHSADQLINPRRPPVELAPPLGGCVRPSLTDSASAWAWFNAERPCLLAAQNLAAERGWNMRAWQLAWGLDTFQYRQGYLHDRINTLHTGLKSAQGAADPTAIFMAHRLLGHAYVRIGKPTEALDHLQRALTMAEGSGDLLDQAHTHSFLVKAWGQTGRDQRALEHAVTAQRLFHDLSYPIWEAQMLKAMGWYLGRLDDHQQARVYCEAALAICRQHEDRQGETDALDALGYLAHLAGSYAQARDYYHQALVLFRELGHTYYQADTLDRLGQTCLALGDHEAARNCWRQALQLFQDQHRSAEADRIQQQLDDLAV